MSRIFLSLITLAITTSSLFAVDIDIKHRVKNRSPGYCSWCCIETLGNYHKIESLYNLVEKRSTEKPMLLMHSNGILEPLPVSGTIPLTIKLKLNELKVKYTLGEEGYDNKFLLKRANDDGCIVNIKKGVFGEFKHAILLTYFDDDKIEFIDPNDVKNIYVGTRAWFDLYWSGECLVLDK